MRGESIEKEDGEEEPGDRDERSGLVHAYRENDRVGEARDGESWERHVQAGNRGRQKQSGRSTQ